MNRSNLVRGRRGLSQVVTTLILLVISILMASGTVAYYGIAVTSSSLKQEQLVIREAHVWVNASGAQAALRVENIGGRDALIDAVEIRYVEAPWTSVYHAAAAADGGLTPAQGMNITGSFSHAVGDTTLNFTQASGSIVLPVGEEIILYIDQPDSITVDDIGDAITIMVYTSSNQYLALVDVETA